MEETQTWNSKQQGGGSHKHENGTNTKAGGHVESVRKPAHEFQVTDRWGAAVKIPTHPDEVGAWQHLVMESIRQTSWNKIQNEGGVDRNKTLAGKEKT